MIKRLSYLVNVSKVGPENVNDVSNYWLFKSRFEIFVLIFS